MAKKKLKDPKMVKLGKKNRAQGGRFERAIATIFREKWPDSDVARTRQSERAKDSDVTVKNATITADKIWWELENSKNPNPKKKYQQSLDDIAKLKEDRIPVVVWKKNGSPYTQITMDIGDLTMMAGSTRATCTVEFPCLVTLQFHQFMSMLD